MLIQRSQRTIHKINVLTLVLAAFVALVMATPAFAADPTGKITVTKTHKGQEYELYQIFKATIVEGRTATDTDGISYQLLDGKTDLKATVDGAEVDGAQWFKIVNGNVTIKDSTAQAAITDDNADFAAWAKAYGTKIGETKTATADNASVEFTGLGDGYYFITTTTGSLVTVDSIGPDATVEDKNPGTSVDKTITGATSMDENGKKALAQVGTTVDYESRIPITRGAYNYKFTDVMTDGLTLDADSVKVYVVASGADVADGAEDVNDDCGTVAAANVTGEDADITITFDDAWLKTNWGKDIVIQYSATVNSSAIIADASNPNTAKIEYGNEDEPLTDEDEAEVYSAKITVIKVDGDEEPLEGAGFILKNSSNKYYKLVDGVVTWVESEDDAQIVMVSEVTTTTDDDPETEEDESSSTTSQEAVFTGLANGTYTLIEKVVPEGYNKANDETVTIAEHDYTVGNLAQSRTVINQSGTELPSTGGMGTTILYTIGGIMLVGGAIALVSKKRVANMEK